MILRHPARGQYVASIAKRLNQQFTRDLALQQIIGVENSTI